MYRSRASVMGVDTFFNATFKNGLENASINRRTFNLAVTCL